MRGAGWQVALLTGMLLLMAPVGWTQEDSAQEARVGLTVQPGGMLIQHVTPGEVYDLAEHSGIRLKVSNQGPEAVTYQLSSHQPSQVGNGKWLEGYAEIPDPSWFVFEPEVLTVEAGGEGHANMYLSVPDGAEHLNQHWVVSLGVRGQAQPGEALALAVYPRYQIETEARMDEETIPSGSLGLKPSVLRYSDISLSSVQERQITLHNDSAASHQYALSVKTVPVDASRERIVPSPGYAWFPDVTWVSIEQKAFVIEAKGSRVVNVSVNASDAPAFAGKNWEALLWVAPDEGEPRFARIQIETSRVPIFE